MKYPTCAVILTALSQLPKQASIWYILFRDEYSIHYARINKCKRNLHTAKATSYHLSSGKRHWIIAYSCEQSQLVQKHHNILKGTSVFNYLFDYHSWKAYFLRKKKVITYRHTIFSLIFIRFVHANIYIIQPFITS